LRELVRDNAEWNVALIFIAHGLASIRRFTRRRQSNARCSQRECSGSLRIPLSRLFPAASLARSTNL
jgi:hypothetical protein